MRLGDQAHRGALLTTRPGPTHHARPMRVKQEATAGDRSLKTIEATAGRTAEHVDAGKAGFVVAAAENRDVGDRRTEGRGTRHLRRRGHAADDAWRLREVPD